MTTERSLDVDDEQVEAFRADLANMFRTALLSNKPAAVASLLTALGASLGTFVAMIHAIPPNVTNPNRDENDLKAINRELALGVAPFLDQIKATYDQVLRDQQLLNKRKGQS